MKTHINCSKSLGVMVDEEFPNDLRKDTELMVDKAIEKYVFSKGMSIEKEARELLIRGFEEFQTNLVGAALDVAIKKGRELIEPEQLVLETENIMEVANNEIMMKDLMNKAFDIAKIKKD